MQSSGYHVAVSGIVGAGKTTLVTNLAPLLGFGAAPERPDLNPYLARFFAEPSTWGLRSAAWFFQRALADELSARVAQCSVVQERIVEDHVEVFAAMYHAAGYIDGDDLDLLRALLDDAGTLLPPSDLLIHVDIEPRDARSRIRARGRPYEQETTERDLQELASRYETFLDDWTECAILRIDSRDFDFRAQNSLEALAGEVMRQLRASTELRLPASPDNTWLVSHVSSAQAADSFRLVTERLREFRHEREWQPHHTPRHLALSLVVELGELLEHFQWKDDIEIKAAASGLDPDVRDEVADVAIYVLQLADVLGIDLASAIARKLKINAGKYPVEAARGRRDKYSDLRRLGREDAE